RRRGGRDHRMTPVVSVIVPTYNRAAFIEDSVRSLLAETGVAFEVIVVDDGSTDDTAARLEALRDPRVRVVCVAHGGVGAARNAGLAVAEGRFLAFHDSDDVALPGRLARPVAALEADPALGLVIQNGRMLPSEDAPEAAPQPWIRPEVTRALVGRRIGVA